MGRLPQKSIKQPKTMRNLIRRREKHFCACRQRTPEQRTWRLPSSILDNVLDHTYSGRNRGPRRRLCHLLAPNAAWPHSQIRDFAMEIQRILQVLYEGGSEAQTMLLTDRNGDPVNQSIDEPDFSLILSSGQAYISR